MERNDKNCLLRFYISSTDKFRHKPLYEVIVYAAKRFGLSGATVLRGVMGYGSSSVIHAVKFFEITEKLPLVVEIVDEPAKTDAFFRLILPYLVQVKTGCMVTSQEVNVLFCKTGNKKGQ